MAVRNIFRRGLLFCLIMMPFFVQAEVSSETDSRIVDMQAQIDALNKRLGQLELRLQQMTQLKRSSPTALRAQPELTALEEVEKLRTSWQQLHRGLSKAELQLLLGEPASRLKLEQQMLWYYSYPAIGSGSIMFDYSGKVSAWQEPPFP